MIYYVIPARAGSKGLPNKNEILFEYTLQSIPKDYWNNIVVTTDHDGIKEKYNYLKIIDRPEVLSNDTANIKDVLIHASSGMKETDVIVMLYLTYPQRTFEEIECALKFFFEYKADSLLCRKKTKTHPYLCIYESGKQVVKHDLYRRQDYPACYEISHYIAIVKVSELKKLNKNLYNIDTFYYEIGDVIDVDTIEDLEKYRGKK